MTSLHNPQIPVKLTRPRSETRLTNDGEKKGGLGRFDVEPLGASHYVDEGYEEPDGTEQVCDAGQEEPRVQDQLCIVRQQLEDASATKYITKINM